MAHDLAGDRGIARPRVWGIGLTRTGTTSLNQALRRLGYQAVHWPTTAALLYGDLEAATDESVAAMFEYLDYKHPGSKFVLTHRPEQEWLASTKLHRAEHTDRHQMLLRQPLTEVSVGHRNRWVELVFTQMKLYGAIDFDRAMFASGYRRYHDHVARYFSGREADILTLRICDGQGWNELCAFLGHAVPEVVFPRANAMSAQTDPSGACGRPTTYRDATVDRQTA